MTPVGSSVILQKLYEWTRIETQAYKKYCNKHKYSGVRASSMVLNVCVSQQVTESQRHCLSDSKYSEADS